MLNLLLYRHSLDIDQAQFDHSYIVCPNPQIADSVRTQFPKAQVVTIASFLAGELARLCPEKLTQFKPKAELLTSLAAAWKKQYPNRSFDNFEYCFNLLTDLRSYTLAADILMTVLDEFPKSVREGVFFLFQVMDALELYDEHRAYFELSMQLKMGDIADKVSNHQDITFWGFQFFTGMQIDYLKSLSLGIEVTLPLHADIYQQARATDWPTWLEDTRLNIKKLDTQKETKGKSLKIKLFNDRDFNQVLRKLDQADFFSGKDLVFLNSKFNFDTIQEITIKGIGYKTSIDLLNLTYQEIEEDLFSFLKVPKTITNVLSFIDQNITALVPRENYLKIKGYLSLRKIMTEWQAWLGPESIIDQFDFAHFSVQLELKKTRNTLFSHGKAIFDKKSLLTENFSQDNVLFLNSRYGSLKSTGEKYSSRVEALLAPVGPIRRGGFDFLFFKMKLLELLNQGDNLLLVDYTTFENDIGLKEVLADIEYEVSDLEIASQYREKKNILDFTKLKDKNFQKVSATSLQNYIDCPQKFKISSLKETRIDPGLKSKIQKFELGRIEHAIIEEYFKKETQWDLSFFSSLTEKVLNQFLSINNKKVSREDYQEIVTEVKTLAANGIKEISKIPWSTKKFEDDLAQYCSDVSGRVDFWGKVNDHLMIIDFKRSSGSIPSKKEILSFEKIQLLFYLDKLESLMIKKVSIAYLDLSEPEKSVVMTNSPESAIDFDQYSFLVGAKVYPLEKFSDLMKEYRAFEKEKIKELKVDQSFVAKPAHKDVCRYCPLTSLCPKEPLEMNYES